MAKVEEMSVVSYSGFGFIRAPEPGRLAAWCGHLLLKHGPSPGTLEIRCPNRRCGVVNRRGPDV